ncbi:MAG: nuclear transport factor 2 family protein [Spirochaetes bacterium]|nr:nuclear transport factor 2 family protein [Spirochaetota bacterium]MBU0957080.1 nuclear transport factor 2 family protein [Spirochaetota bacterium]
MAGNAVFKLETEEQIRDLWSRTYNTLGKPDWSHIFPYYDTSIVFKDSIQQVEGIADFKALCDRLTQRCQELRMEIKTLVKSGPVVFMQWEMTMIFKKTPSSTIYGCTKLTLNEAGKIVHQRDYYDLWGDIFDNIPWFAKPYRKFMHKKFG